MTDEMKPSGQVFYSTEEFLEHLRSLSIETPKDELPPFENGESLHIEYVQLNTVEDGGHLTNMVDLAHSRNEAVEKVTKLLADEAVYAVHLRRYPQPIKGVHLYNESQPLARAQSEAYMERQSAKNLTTAYERLSEEKQRGEEALGREIETLTDIETAYRRVIEDLMDSIRRAHTQLQRDNQNCTYPEPVQIMNLLCGVGITPDEKWERNMLAKAREKAREERKHREAVELAERTGVWPLPKFTHGGNSQERRCACGMTWHKDEVPPWHNGLECQKPTHEQQVAWAKRTTVWPVAKMIKGGKRQCACGQTWPADKVSSRHNGLECQAEMCETRFNGGPCAGEKGHDGTCSPHPKHFRKCTVRACGHLEASHHRTLPEDGGQEYCAECLGDNEFHSFEPEVNG